MKSMEAMPHGFRTGKNMLMGFDPATGKLTARDATLGTYNLATIMGGAEVMMELNMSIDDPAWQKLWVDFCTNSGAGISQGKLVAYAYHATKDPALAQNALAGLRGGGGRARGGRVLPPNALAAIDDGVDTNGSSQSGLNAIAVLELCADVLPTAVPTAPAGGFGGGGRGPNTPPAGDGGA
jgi:hypothetical protein